jgi:transglutaminase-like putative cysteine protease
MELIFSDTVRQHQFTLRMTPHSDARQTVRECSISINPHCTRYEDIDNFGNRYIYGSIEDFHDSFCVDVTGTADIDNEKKAEVSESDLIYRFQSGYTKPGSLLCAYFAEHGRLEDEAEKEYVLRIMHSVYRDMIYQKGVTSVETTAEQAFSKRVGVCQDYAHIMISVLRMAGIPARYVVGMMLGEGYSHAWVEAAVDGVWIGLDPTNDKETDDTYIRIAGGRDYQDCIVNRGSFCGYVTQEQRVKVVVSEV